MISLRELLRAASRTFAIGIEQLPGVLCDAGTVAYLLLRVSDYLEDNEDMPAEEKIALLNLWAEILKGNAKSEQLTEPDPKCRYIQPRRTGGTTCCGYPDPACLPSKRSSGDHPATCRPHYIWYGTLDRARSAGQ